MNFATENGINIRIDNAWTAIDRQIDSVEIG